MFFRISNKIKNTIFCLGIIILMTLFCCHKANNETNLLKTILPANIIESTSILNVADKSASVIRVIFEAESENDLTTIKTNFTSNINKDFYNSYTSEINDLISYFTSTPTNFLSYETRKLLKQKKYDILYEKALMELYNPLNIPLTELNQDPYFLLTDYMKSQDFHFNSFNHLNNKYFDTMVLNIKDHTGLSPDIINSEIKELIKLQHKYSQNGKIYLAGSPIHTYYASQNSMISINIICLLATLFIVSITYFYFKDFKLLLPIVLSILVGFGAGYVATISIFQTFHVLTLVFATTLIGIGVDYSYHYILSKEINAEFIKNLTYSLITTVTAFILLYLTDIELLKEISVFVAVGLVAIYLTVLLIYPNFKFPKVVKTIQIANFVKKYRKAFLFVFVLIIFAGFPKIHYNDSLNAFYEPTKELKNAEILFSKVSNQNFAQSKILAIKGSSFEDILQKEEIITDKLHENNITFFSLSKIFPSAKRQNENIKLVRELYQNNLNKFTDYLTVNQITTLKTVSVQPILPDFTKYNSLNNFMLKDNTSIIFVNSKDLPIIQEDFVEIIDISENCEKYLKEYRLTLLKLLPIVLICALGILSILYKFKKSIKVLLPPIIGGLVAICTLSLFNVPINMFTIIALFLILGFTIDYSIFRVGNDNNSEDAITISCMTTLFSFCALSFVSFKFISSLSIILFLGILTSYIAGILLVREDKEQM